MARRKVVLTPMYKYERATPKSPFLGWGKYAVRKTTTVATSPRLLAYRSCIAAALGGKEYPNLEAVQTAFREAAARCAREAASKPTVPKKKLPKGFRHKY